MTPERTMTPLAIAIILSLVGGGVGGFALGGGFGKSSQTTQVEVKTDAPETVEAVGGVVEAAVAEDVTDAQTRQIIAGSDVKVIGMQYLVDSGADHALVGALVEYDIAASATAIKDSGAFGTQAAQSDVSRALGRVPVPCAESPSVAP